ncbi:MAG: AmmeMemoRadiSam system protein B [Chloroflexia bacterium]
MFRRGVSQSDIRPSPIAGTWYPGTREDLEAMVDRFLARVPEPQIEGHVVGLVAPHAGYPYSGQVAAYAYRLLQGRREERVVVLSPCHAPYPGRFAVTAMRYYATPLGLVEVDRETVDRLAEYVPLTRLDYDEEHSLEIQLPFLQRTLGDFLLVPVMLCDQTWEDCQELAEALDRVLGGERPLLVASTDLCHAYSYEQVRASDAATLAALERGEAREFWETAMRLHGACGYGPVTAALLVARRWGAERVVVLHATNSGDVTGQRMGYVVGYAAAALLGKKAGAEA